MEEDSGPTVDRSIGADTVERTIVVWDSGGMLNTSLSVDVDISETDVGTLWVRVDIGANVRGELEPPVGADVTGGAAPEIVSEGSGNPPVLQVSS